ncbi:hypothetical protein [Wohlfahrtiimonas chitiniclastica]|uniref:hypothetical protein n=1 Tax=Wohlfahrtiimonas chitiniclastica TaxID=400946 RepID=UPI001BD0AEE4|nr:hypothetical protein [Wohlfahrtiimonas chitiniclastica]MBS7829224.1 hypothetical protein [Wohlfahrtiimonas chitiniclastica]MBS7836462.1 hypothetical protein [Wohlfahrtiimonas chitiniclastica]
MSRLLINEPPLMVLPSLAVKIGLNEAMFIQQLHYLLQVSNNERDGQLWAYNSYDEWAAIFPFWSVATIKRIISNLIKANLIKATSQYNRMKMDRTNWYTIDYDALDNMSRSLGQNDTSIGSNCTNGEDQNAPMSLDQIDPTNNHKNKTTAKTTNKREGQAPTQPKFNALQELIKRGADKQYAKDLISNRKTRRLAVLTLSIIDHMQKEAAKVGLSIAEVVELCAMKGWGGFEARYYQESRPTKVSNHDLSKQDYSKDENIIPKWMLDLEVQENKS